MDENYDDGEEEDYGLNDNEKGSEEDENEDLGIQMIKKRSREESGKQKKNEESDDEVKGE